jgi:hypothetical protein
MAIRQEPLVEAPIFKCNPLPKIFELAPHIKSAYLPNMSPTPSSALTIGKASPFRRLSPDAESQSQLPANSSLKHSLSASVFLGACLALYFVAGFVALTVVERIWTALVQ